jgi:peroxiredoxin Q/BCP
MLQIGDAAPAFEAPDQDGKVHRLSDYKGKKLVLYFYPKDNTPGCTDEACNLRDHYQAFQNEGFEILGVSPDSEASHRKFATKFQLPFPLLSDPQHSIAEAYESWGLKKFMGREYMGILRSTFVIGSDGKISNIIRKVDTKKHHTQLLP